MKKNPYEKIIRLLEWIIVNKHNKRMRELPLDKDLKKVLWKLPDVSDLFKNRNK